MEPQYVLYIVVVVVLGAVALAMVLRYRRSSISLKLPGGELKAEGERDSQQLPSTSQPSGSSATTDIGGGIKDSTIITSAAGSGEAKTRVGQDVEKSDILTETK